MYNSKTGAHIHTIAAIAAAGSAVTALLAHGPWLLAGVSTGACRVVNVRSFVCEHSFEKHTAAITGAETHPDEGLVVTSAEDGVRAAAAAAASARDAVRNARDAAAATLQVRVWELDTGIEVQVRVHFECTYRVLQLLQWLTRGARQVRHIDTGEYVGGIAVSRLSPRRLLAVCGTHVKVCARARTARACACATVLLLCVVRAMCVCSRHVLDLRAVCSRT